MAKTSIAILGSGNIGTDLLMKVLQLSEVLEPFALVGVDPDSDGLARARRLGVRATHDGIDGLLAMPGIDDVEIIFDATSAHAHVAHDAKLRPRGIRVVDLTPAAIGPYVVPVVNLNAHLDAPNVNMVTCGGQATIPIVAAISAVKPVHYAEIVASIASRSAGPGTRANIDEFTETTSRAIEVVGGAKHGKAIIVLNPAEPPLMMRDTVYALTDTGESAAIEASITAIVADVARYVAGYRLKQRVQFETFDRPLRVPGVGVFERAMKTTVFLEVEGAGHYLPAYAGNLDIMTSAALATAERIARVRAVA